MRILILGADGMFGHVAFMALARSHEVHGTCRRAFTDSPLAAVAGRARVFDRTEAGDEARLREVFHAVRPEAVVNCIGLVKQRPDAGDPVRQVVLNALLPHTLAALADHVGAKLVQLGTDCVFSGRRGRYRPDDLPDPADLYGRAKLLGEVGRPPHLTLRTSFIGRQLEGAYGLLEWFLAQRGPVSGYVHAVFSGLTTAALVDVLDLVLQRRPDLSGVLHVASEPIGKHDLLCRVRDALGSTVEIVPEHGVRYDRSLDGSAFAAATGIAVPGWDAMLARLAVDAPRYEQWRTKT